MISSALLLCIMLSVSVAPQAVAQNTVWMQRVVPGRFYNDNSEGSKIQIRCIPEDNRICAVIYIQIDASNDPIDRVPGNYGLRAGVGTGDSSRVGLWIPDLNQGYCRVRFDGMLWNSGDNSLGIYLYKETTTHHVESKQVLEQCLGIND
jgi:hypothetical protein